MEEAGFEAETRRKLLQDILDKDFVAVVETVKRADIPEEHSGVRELLVDLPMFIGDLPMLRKAGSLVRNEKASAALRELEKMHELLACYGLEQYLRFDLSMIGYLGYYTGIIFSGYTYGTGFSILDGGRYDGLITRFGKDYPSVGFAIKLNDLAAAMKNQHIVFPMERAETLLAYTEAGQRRALAAGDELRRQGIAVENSFFGDDMPKNIAYAKAKEMGGILFFEDEDRICAVNVRTGEENAVSIEEIVRGDAL